MNKAYDKVTWVNKPSTASPINQTNLNKMSDALDIIDDRVIALDSGKVSSVTVTNTLATGDTIATITVDGTATNIKSAQITVDSEISTTSTNPVQNKVIAEALREVMPEVTVEGNPISITDGSNIVPAKLAEVTFLPKQSGSGEPSPDNVRPISGWTEVNLMRSGKNLFDKNSCIRGYINSTTGAIVNDNSNFLTDYTIKLTQGQSICISANASCNNIGIGVYNTDGSFIRRVQTNNVTKQSYTAESDCIVRCSFNYDGTQRSVDDWKTMSDTLQIMIEFNSVRTDYVAYTATTYTKSLGSTYYGGKVTWNADGSCTATIDTYYITENNFVLGSSGTSSGGLHYFNTSNTPMASGKVEGKCNMLEYKQSGWSSTTPCYCTKEGASPSFTPVRIYDDSTTLAEFKTKYDGLQITYPLATPIELTLTPQEIELLKGQNVLWSDSNGNIKLTYSADIKAFIESQLQNS